MFAAHFNFSERIQNPVKNLRVKLRMLANEHMWFWRSDHGGIQANNHQPKIFAPLSQVTEENLPAVKKYIFAIYLEVETARDTTCFQTSGLNDKLKLVPRPQGPWLHDTVLAASWHKVT